MTGRADKSEREGTKLREMAKFRVMGLCYMKIQIN